MDLYIPRKWYASSFYRVPIFCSRLCGVLITFFFTCSSATNRLITSKDHASVQINIGHLDESGTYTGQFTTFALCGFVRAQVIFYCYLQLNSLYILRLMACYLQVQHFCYQLLFLRFFLAFRYNFANTLESCLYESFNY